MSQRSTRNCSLTSRARRPTMIARSLLAVHNAVAARTDGFSYLGIGSHLGGSLQAVIADPRCTRAVSIDPRPQSRPDDRPEQSTCRVSGQQHRANVEAASKTCRGLNCPSWRPSKRAARTSRRGNFSRPDFCFVDGEHTYRAALRDARFCRTVMHGAGVLAFHDFRIGRNGHTRFPDGRHHARAAAICFPTACSSWSSVPCRPFLVIHVFVHR